MTVSFGEQYMKAKLMNLQLTVTPIYQRLVLGHQWLKKGYHLRQNIPKDEKSDLVTDSHSILARWSNHFSQLLNVHGVNDVRQTEIQTAEPLIPKPVPLSLRWLMKT
jgi:hypothetical protein